MSNSVENRRGPITRPLGSPAYAELRVAMGSPSPTGATSLTTILLLVMLVLRPATRPGDP
jgi:hypothetical protein